MKTITILMTGLITCTAVFKAQSIGTDTVDANGQHSAIPTIVYRELIWTNGIFLPSIEGNAFSTTNSSATNLIRAVQTDLSSNASDYQVIILSQDETMEDAIDKEAERVSQTDTNPAPAGVFTREDVLYWKYGAISTNSTAPNGGKGSKTPTRIIVIEPLNAVKGIPPENIRLREYVFGGNHPKPGEDTWYDPRKIVSKWMEFWMNGTDATPVVLVLTKF